MKRTPTREEAERAIAALEYILTLNAEADLLRESYLKIFGQQLRSLRSDLLVARKFDEVTA